VQALPLSEPPPLLLPELLPLLLPEPPPLLLPELLPLLLPLLLSELPSEPLSPPESWPPPLELLHADPRAAAPAKATAKLVPSHRLSIVSPYR
jgi:hypothetical protein